MIVQIRKRNGGRKRAHLSYGRWACVFFKTSAAQPDFGKSFANAYFPGYRKGAEYMEERLKSYIARMEKLAESWDKEDGTGPAGQEKAKQMEDLLIQIGFFQHERLVHLIVTVTFALLTMLAILGTMIDAQPAMFILILLLIVLLVPYIRHYYILENGVQKLYKYYDRLMPAVAHERHEEQV